MSCIKIATSDCAVRFSGRKLGQQKKYFGFAMIIYHRIERIVGWEYHGGDDYSFYRLLPK